MTIIYLSAVQTADQNLLQALCRSVSELAKKGSLLLLREAALNGDGMPDAALTLARAKYLAGQLNESGVAVVSVEGSDRGLFKFPDGDSLRLGKQTWLTDLLDKRIVVSLSLLGKTPSGKVRPVPIEVLDTLGLNVSSNNSLVMLHPKGKARVEINGVQQNELSISQFIVELALLESNYLKSIKQLVNLDIRVTNTIGLLSDNIERSTKLVR